VEAETDFSLTNQLLRLTHSKVSRTEGRLQAEYPTDLNSSEYYWSILSQIDPRVAKNFFTPAQGKIFDDLIFTTSPLIQAELQGARRDPDRLLFRAQATAGHFSFRGEAITWFESQVEYTNQTLTFFAPLLERPEGQARVGVAAIDFATLLLYLTNAESQLDPMAIARVVGPHAVRAIAPYQFASPPQAQVHGVVDLKPRSHRTDLHFQLQGGPFRWKKFRFPQISGQVDWVGETVGLEQVLADLTPVAWKAGLVLTFRQNREGSCLFKAR